MTILARLGRSHPRCLGVGTTQLSPSRSGSASSLGGGQRLRGRASSALCPRRLELGCGGVEVQEHGLGSWRRPLDRERGSRTQSTGPAHACGSASPSAAAARGPAAATSAAATPTRRPPRQRKRGVLEAVGRRRLPRVDVPGRRLGHPPTPYSPGCFRFVGRAAGYVSSMEVLEPSWTRAQTNARGEWVVEQARLDCRFLGPPDDPLVYGDVVVTHPEDPRGSRCG